MCVTWLLRRSEAFKPFLLCYARVLFSSGQPLNHVWVVLCFAFCTWILFDLLSVAVFFPQYIIWMVIRRSYLLTRESFSFLCTIDIHLPIMIVFSPGIHICGTVNYPFCAVEETTYHAAILPLGAAFLFDILPVVWSVSNLSYVLWHRVFSRASSYCAVLLFLLINDWGFSSEFCFLTGPTSFDLFSCHRLS